MANFWRERHRQNESFDPFSSPNTSGIGKKRVEVVEESVDVFSTPTTKRRSTGESGSLSRAIGNALNATFDSMDAFYSPSFPPPPTDDVDDLNDSASILAAVSSAHATSSGAVTQNTTKKKKTLAREESDRGRLRWGTEQLSLDSMADFLPRKQIEQVRRQRQNLPKSNPLAQEARRLADDFWSPDKIEQNRRRAAAAPRAATRKQTRMDEYLFKARRVDQGAREFRLQTTHEPRRGSKKKRDSIEQLEVTEIVDITADEHEKEEDVLKENRQKTQNAREEDVDVDFSLAFGTPSPVRRRHQKARNTKMTQFLEKKKTTLTVKSAPVSQTLQPEEAAQRRTSSWNDDDYGASASSDLSTRRPVLKHLSDCSSRAMTSSALSSASQKTSDLFRNVSRVPTASRPREKPSDLFRTFTGPSTSSEVRPHSVIFNDPSAYHPDDSTPLDTTRTSSPSPPHHILAETMPWSTPSPAKKARRRRNEDEEVGEVEEEEGVVDQKRQQQQKHKRRKQQCQGGGEEEEGKWAEPVKRKKRANKPIFDEDPPKDDEKPSKPFHREALAVEEAERRKFGHRAAEREQLMRRLVDEKFIEARETGGLEQRRAELRDGDVIRNREQRKNLMHGTACKCCRGYYDGLAMGEEEKREYIDRVSRHRYVHQALPDTPEKYWDLTLGPRDEEEEEDEEVGDRSKDQKRNEWGRRDDEEKASRKRGIQNWN